MIFHIVVFVCFIKFQYNFEVFSNVVFEKMVDNICVLNNLENSSILSNLKERFQNKAIYVSTILVQDEITDFLE